MKKITLSILLGLTVISCSNIKKDYEIKDISYSPTPKWVKNGKYKASKEDKYKYFVSRAENTNQRLCQKTANARANLVVASEIANNINDAFQNTISSNGNENNEITTEKLQQNVKLYLAGVQNEENYWEKRKYLKKLGADEDITKFQCYSLVKMNKENYNRAVNASIDKMISTISIENKEQVANDIKNKIIENEN